MLNMYQQKKINTVGCKVIFINVENYFGYLMNYKI